MSVWFLVFLGYTAMAVGRLGWLGAVLVVGAVGFVAALVVMMQTVAYRQSKRRNAEVAAGHPGWHVATVLTTRSQAEAMRSTGNRLIVQVATTLTYGPAGIELWARHKTGSLIKIFSYPWPVIADVSWAADVRNMRGFPAQGLRITLVDGRREELLAVRPADVAGAARASKSRLVKALADDIAARRTAPVWPDA